MFLRTPGQMTMHTVTQLLVHSPVFFEIRRLHLYIVDCVFTGVASSLHQCLKCHCSKAAWKVGEKIWAQQVSSGMERQEIGLDRIDEFVSLAAASLTNKGARQKLREKLTLEWSELVEDVLKNGIGSCMNAKKREKVKSDEGNERSSDNKMVDHLSEQLEVRVFDLACYNCLVQFRVGSCCAAIALVASSRDPSMFSWTDHELCLIANVGAQWTIRLCSFAGETCGRARFK